ncbi:hypothetical protein MQC73_04155, partial [Escherichia coli]|nr:hypothetical protein [Escherichia coli]
WLMMSLWDALRMNMMISYQELVRTFLKKSNKTISAQKNSAMRRLAIHSNAEMYAWINSAQGARELNLPSVYGDAAEWNTAELRREMSHS